MNIKIERVNNIADFNIHREMLWEAAKENEADYSKYVFELDRKEKEYLINYHELYLVLDDDTKAIIGSYSILVLSTGLYCLFGFGIKKPYRKRGIGGKVLRKIYDKYEDLIFFCGYRLLGFYSINYSKCKYENLHIATSYVPLPNDMVLPCYDNKSTRPQEVFISTKTPLLGTNNKTKKIVEKSLQEVRDIVTHYIPEKKDN